jgi:uncharacterized beta-barrel protein YwiB (DUF1934 family)
MKCIVNLQTLTLVPNEEPLRYEFTAPGRITTRSDGGFTVRYEETSGDGESYVNTLKASADGTAEISRQGEYSSAFMLDRDKRHLCMITTPVGSICMGVLTHTIENDISANGGSLYAKYSIDANNCHISDNEVRFQVDVKQSNSLK